MKPEYQSARDIRRLRVWEMADAGAGAQAIADELGVGIATVYRDKAARPMPEDPPKRKVGRKSTRRPPPDPPPPKPAQIPPLPPVVTPRRPRVLTPDRVPVDAETQERVLGVAIMLWRMHVPDALVAVRAMGVSPQLLKRWIDAGAVHVNDGDRESWEARCYLAKGLGLTESLTGYDEQVGIAQRLFQIAQSKDEKAALGAIKLILEQGALRHYFGRSLNVQVEGTLFGAADVANDDDQTSGLAAALGLIGADA